MIKSFGMLNKKRMLMILLAVILTALALPSALFAEDGENNGANQNTPLTLVQSDPAYGDSDVSLTPEISLVFSKNVVNFTVKDNNSNCFKLTDIKGSPVKFSIYFPDDQVYPTEKRNIYITPDSALNYDTQYVLTISDSLTAKSGDRLAGKVQLVFKTMSKSVASSQTQNMVSDTAKQSAASDISGTKTADTIKLPEAAENTASKGASLAELTGAALSQNDKDINANAAADEGKATDASSGGNVFRYIAALLVLALFTAFTVWYIKRRS